MPLLDQRGSVWVRLQSTTGDREGQLFAPARGTPVRWVYTCACGGFDTAENQRVIVEVTPKWRAYMAQLGQDWSTATLSHTLKDHCAEFTGWMFRDSYHDDEAENTALGRPGNWRATAWEIHPVTAIKVVPCP